MRSSMLCETNFGCRYLSKEFASSFFSVRGFIMTGNLFMLVCEVSLCVSVMSRLELSGSKPKSGHPETNQGPSDTVRCSPEPACQCVLKNITNHVPAREIQNCKDQAADPQHTLQLVFNLPLDNGTQL